MENIYLCCYASYPLITFKDALITAVLMSMETPSPPHTMHVLTSASEAFRSNFMNNVPFVKSDQNQKMQMRIFAVLPIHPEGLRVYVYMCEVHVFVLTSLLVSVALQRH